MILESQEKSRILPYVAKKLSNGKNLVTGYFGGWVFLDAEELIYLKANQFYDKSKLYEKLANAGIILNENNIDGIIAMYRNLNRNLFRKPSLHMINVTNVCNQRCTYCHAGVSQGKDFMSEETALKIVKFIFKSSGHPIAIEFQGGECLLNWKVVKLVVEKSREINKVLKRDLRICIVSNLSLLNGEKLKFLADSDVSICTSIDGSKDMHNTYRKFLSGSDTFDRVFEKVQFIREYYKKHGLNKKVDALATITRQALKDPKSIIDTYINLGINILHLRRVDNFGDALNNWQELTYSAEEFFDFWKKAMEYIVELNKKGIDIKERGAYNILSKILNFTDPLYVELMTPTGMGRTTLLYNFDGDVYNSDEGRMINEPIFKIGTVDQEPKDVLLSQDNINIWASSFIDLTAYNSAFRPWGGIHPVQVYQDQGNIIPNLPNSASYKIYSMQCEYLFEKIAESGYEKELFMKWAEKDIYSVN